jgi:hypothetical protein
MLVGVADNHAPVTATVVDAAPPVLVITTGWAAGIAASLVV